MATEQSNEEMQRRAELNLVFGPDLIKLLDEVASACDRRYAEYENIGDDDAAGNALHRSYLQRLLVWQQVGPDVSQESYAHAYETMHNLAKALGFAVTVDTQRLDAESVIDEDGSVNKIWSMAFNAHPEAVCTVSERHDCAVSEIVLRSDVGQGAILEQFAYQLGQVTAGHLEMMYEQQDPSHQIAWILQEHLDWDDAAAEVFAYVYLKHMFGVQVDVENTATFVLSSVSYDKLNVARAMSTAFWGMVEVTGQSGKVQQFLNVARHNNNLN